MKRRTMGGHLGLGNILTHRLPQPSRLRRSQKDFNSSEAQLKGSIEIQSRLRLFQDLVLTFRQKDSEPNQHSKLQMHHF